MGVESTIRAGVGFPILTDGYNLSGALTAGTSPAYYFYSGGSGQYNSISGSNVSGSLYLLTVAGASVPAQNGVVILTAASGIVTRQFQVFPDGPIKGVAQRVWFVKVSSSTGLAVSGGPAPTCEWFVPGSSTPVTLTPGNGAQPDFWYVDLSSGQTNVDAGLLRVTGSGLIPLSIEMFFSTAAASGGGGGVFIPMNPVSDYFALIAGQTPPISKVQSAIGVDVLTAGSYTYETADGTLDTKNFNVGFDPTVVRRLISGPGVMRLALGK